MKILRLGNDVCELADIENSAESIKAEIGGGKIFRLTKEG
jgi:hypothetical protein